MCKIGNKKFKAITLVEIIVSMAIFSFIFTIVISISLMLVKLQTNIQSSVFLTQTAQTTLEDMSRNLRFGYAYSGGDRDYYLRNNYNIRLLNSSIPDYINRERCVTKVDANGIEFQECPLVTDNAPSINSPIVRNSKNSPFIVFESKDGDPTNYIDQNVYCLGLRADGSNTLYKLERFGQLHSSGEYAEEFCTANSQETKDMLPSNIKLDYINFEVFGQSAENPINPMVSMILKLSDDTGKNLQVQTTVTQRLRANIL